VAGYLGSYATLGLTLLGAVVVFTGAFSANRLLRPRRPASPAGKYENYECGLDPVGGDWAQAQIRYYVYAYLYALFAVESVFLFPWAVVFDRPHLRGPAIAEMAIFIGVLALGLLYAWRKNVLRWV
jgi:NADH-quinone oxidoreductase subunit A